MGNLERSKKAPRAVGSPVADVPFGTSAAKDLLCRVHQLQSADEVGEGSSVPS
jgi:hypothetical protein